MRIFKQVDNLVYCIAGEIINLLGAKQWFDNGKLLAKPVLDYPSITQGNIVYSCTCQEVAVSVPAGYNGKVLPLSKTIDELINMIPEDDQTRSNWNLTPVKDSHMTVSRVKTAPIIRPVYNFLTMTLADTYSTYESSINALNRDVGIYLDIYDMTTLPHNSVTFNVTRSLFKSSTQLIDQTIVLNDISNPLMIEMYGKDIERRQRKYKSFTKRLTRVSLDNIDYQQVNLEDGTSSYDACSHCHNQLYDDNYLLEGNVVAAKIEERIILCPVCAHFSAADILRKYMNIKIVKFPTSIHEIIDIKYSDNKVKSDILHATAEKRRYMSVPSCNYVILGDNDGRYIAVDNVDAWITSPIGRHYPNHKVIQIRTLF